MLVMVSLLRALHDGIELGAAKPQGVGDEVPPQPQSGTHGVW
jgi:hypothetical protein